MSTIVIDALQQSSGLLGRLCLAALLGGLVGLERDIHGRAAGLRTHLLVCVGAALFMMISSLVASSVDQAARFADPGRIAAQVITGIGFLGAGAIMKEGVTILFVDSQRDYDQETITISFALRIFHKGATDKISQEIVHSLENAVTPLNHVSWYHGKMY